MTAIIVFASPEQEELAHGLAARLPASLGRLETRSFPDGESYVRIDSPVDGCDAVIACGLDHPNSKIVPLLLLASALKEAGARRVVLAAPYLAYMRQDRAFRFGEAVSARVFARLLSSYFDGVVTVDPHLHRIHNLNELFVVGALAVAAAPALAEWILKNVGTPALVGPDSESEQWVSDVAGRVNCPYVVLEKIRRGDRDVEISLPNSESLHGRSPVLIDDIVSTARTMIAATRHILQLGLPAPVCVGVHAVFSGDAFEELTGAGAGRIVTCNTVRHSSNAIDIRPLMAAAIADMLAS